MPERSRKRPRDLNQMASEIVEEATDGPKPEPEDTRDPAAVELGRKGGLKGGKARAKKLTKEERSEIARKAAIARWRGKRRSKIADNAAKARSSNKNRTPKR